MFVLQNPPLYLVLYMLPVISQIIVCPLWHLHLLKMALLMGYSRALGVEAIMILHLILEPFP